jgi:hypothetical protein
MIREKDKRLKVKGNKICGKMKRKFKLNGCNDSKRGKKHRR